MSADEIPASVYEDAARAFYAGMGYKEDAVERMAEAYAERGHFRAVVESAYRAGVKETDREWCDILAATSDAFAADAHRVRAGMSGETKEPDQ